MYLYKAESWVPPELRAPHPQINFATQGRGTHPRAE